MVALANRTPVSPPQAKREMNPRAGGKGVWRRIVPYHMVAIHEKHLMAVGTAIIRVAAVNRPRAERSPPTQYMWCAQTRNPRRAIDIIA